MLARVCLSIPWCAGQRERDKEREREREEKEINRKMMAALKGMTCALAPLSYLVIL